MLDFYKINTIVYKNIHKQTQVFAGAKIYTIGFENAIICIESSEVFTINVKKIFKKKKDFPCERK